jgi:hypothetical protein
MSTIPQGLFELLSHGTVAGRRTRRKTDRLCSDKVAGGRDGIAER